MMSKDMLPKETICNHCGTKAPAKSDSRRYGSRRKEGVVIQYMNYECPKCGLKIRLLVEIPEASKETINAFLKGDNYKKDEVKK